METDRCLRTIASTAFGVCKLDERETEESKRIFSMVIWANRWMEVSFTKNKGDDTRWKENNEFSLAVLSVRCLWNAPM